MKDVRHGFSIPEDLLSKAKPPTSVSPKEFNAYNYIPTSGKSFVDHLTDQSNKPEAPIFSSTKAEEDHIKQLVKDADARVPSKNSKVAIDFGFPDEDKQFLGGYKDDDVKRVNHLKLAETLPYQSILDMILHKMGRVLSNPLHRDRVFDYIHEKSYDPSVLSKESLTHAFAEVMPDTVEDPYTILQTSFMDKMMAELEELSVVHRAKQMFMEYPESATMVIHLDVDANLPEGEYEKIVTHKIPYIIKKHKPDELQQLEVLFQQTTLF